MLCTLIAGKYRPAKKDENKSGSEFPHFGEEKH
jgi:hypothetical protein